MLESSRLVIMANRSLSCFRDNSGRRYHEEMLYAPKDKKSASLHLGPDPGAINETSQSTETLDEDRHPDLDKDRTTDMSGRETIPPAWRAIEQTNPQRAPEEINPREQAKRSVIYIELANNSPATKRRTQDAATVGSLRKSSVTPQFSGESVEKRKPEVGTRTSEIVDVDKVIFESEGGIEFLARRRNEPPAQCASSVDSGSVHRTSFHNSEPRNNSVNSNDRFVGMKPVSSKPPKPISSPKKSTKPSGTTNSTLNEVKSKKPLDSKDADKAGEEPRKLVRLQSLNFEPSVTKIDDGPLSPYSPDLEDQKAHPFQRTFSLVYKPVYNDKSVVAYSPSIRAKNIEGGYRFAKYQQSITKELKFHKFEEITDNDAPKLMRAESFNTPTLPRPRSSIVMFEVENTREKPQSSPPIDMPTSSDVEATRRVKPQDLDFTQTPPELKRPSEFSSPNFIERFSFITSPKPYKSSFNSKSNDIPHSSDLGNPLWSPESSEQSGLSLNAKDSIGKDIATTKSSGTPRSSSAAPVRAPAPSALAPAPTTLTQARPGMETVENGLRAAPRAPERRASSSLVLAAKEDSCDDGVADSLVTIPGQEDEEVVQRQAAAAEDGNFESVQPKTGSLKHKKRKKKKSSAKNYDECDSSLKETENQSAADVVPTFKMGPSHIFKAEEETPSQTTHSNPSIDKIEAHDYEDVGSKEKVEEKEKVLATGMSKRKTSYAHTAMLERERAGFPPLGIMPAYSQSPMQDCLRIERNSILRKEARNILDLVMSLDSASYGHANNAPTDKPPDVPKSNLE